jgi:hypothetical protein
MKRLLEISWWTRRSVLALILALLSVHNAAMCDDAVSIDDIRFASQIGTAPLTDINPSITSTPTRVTDFVGTTEQSCAALDLDTFLRQFNPRELLIELRQSLLSGAQSEISNYLLALAYSAPTLASVLDMTDRQLHARFSAFSRTCSNQQSRAVGFQESESRLARAANQCYSRETSHGTSPTDAYRWCSFFRASDGLPLPAALTTIEFLRQHSDLAITPRIQSLLALLPDERISAGNYQVRPPKLSLGTLANAMQIRSRLALDQVIEGAPLGNISECTPDSILSPTGSACLPRSGFEIVNSPAFRGARLLASPALSLFKDALSSQMAVTAVYSDLLELAQRFAEMNLRSDSDASATEVLSRQRVLQAQVARLLGQADLRFKVQQSKLQVARTQLLALERSRMDLQARTDALREVTNSPTFSMMSLLRLFQNRD